MVVYENLADKKLKYSKEGSLEKVAPTPDSIQTHTHPRVGGFGQCKECVCTNF